MSVKLYPKYVKEESCFSYCIRELLSHSLVTAAQYCHGVLWLLTKYCIVKIIVNLLTVD